MLQWFYELWWIKQSTFLFIMNMHGHLWFHQHLTAFCQRLNGDHGEPFRDHMKKRFTHWKGSVMVSRWKETLLPSGYQSSVSENRGNSCQVIWGAVAADRIKTIKNIILLSSSQTTGVFHSGGKYPLKTILLMHPVSNQSRQASLHSTDVYLIGLGRSLTSLPADMEDEFPPLRLTSWRTKVSWWQKITESEQKIHKKETWFLLAAFQLKL